ncbi:hypothetical protein L2A60_11115 [Acidiphilium iwatense]|uniref:Uncharacterized protein n=2 Tax=Acidiphilium iwatense TaxID=768198 RepID=A0ABS9DYJ7_9PROT|nr:hypothetical protein [Acidiphilium iwatense]
MFAAATVGVHGVGGIGIADFGRARHHRGVFGADHVFGWWFVIERMTSPFLGDAHAPILGVVAVGMFVGGDMHNMPCAVSFAFGRFVSRVGHGNLLKRGLGAGAERR